MAKIAFFDTKSYDREAFNKVNKQFGFDISYYKERLSMNTVSLTRDMDKYYYTKLLLLFKF